MYIQLLYEDGLSFHWDWVGDWKESEVGGRVDHIGAFVVRISEKVNPYLNIFNRRNVFIPLPPYAEILTPKVMVWGVWAFESN